MNKRTGRERNTKARCSPPVRPRFSRGELIHCQQTASVSVQAAAACFSRSRAKRAKGREGEGGIGSHRLDSGGLAGGRDYCSFADNEGQASESGRPTEPLLTALCPRPSPAAFVTERQPLSSAAAARGRPFAVAAMAVTAKLIT